MTHNVLGFSRGIRGPNLLNVLREQADQYGARRISGQIDSLQRQADGSLVGLWQEGQVSAAKVLIATGGLDVEPQIKDVEKLVEAGIIRHCPICDAYEATGKRIALVAYGKCRTKEALLLRGYTSDLTVLTLGNAAEISPHDRAILEAAGIRLILHPMERLTRERDKIAAWSSKEPNPLYFDAIYSALGMHLRSELAVSAGAEIDDEGAVLTDRHQQTTVPGLYAAGDVDVVHGLSQVSVAAGQAAIASTAINGGLPALRYESTNQGAWTAETFVPHGKGA
jgi:thioredoxin reductase (NADPH)